VYVEDTLNLGVREWMEQANPHALQEMAATMMEASRKGYWKADAKTLQSLARVYRESVAKHGESNGLMSGGNKQLEQFIGRQLDAPGSVPTGASQGASSGPAPPAPGSPPPAPTANASTIVGQVLAPVQQALRRPAPATAQMIGTVAIGLLSTASMALLLTGFVRREGAL
jgi:cobaltochelatase CobN